jgi:hypothetical protein
MGGGGSARLPTLMRPGKLDAERRARYPIVHESRYTARTMKEDPRRTARDLRAAIIFGIVAATLELAVLLYFFR